MKTDRELAKEAITALRADAKAHRMSGDADGYRELAGYADLIERLANMNLDTQAIRDVVAERRLQVEVEGWTAEHDDAHIDGSMAQAAACYTRHAAREDQHRYLYPAGNPPPGWRWSNKWWKPSTARQDLVKAAALLLAEIERLDRLAAREAEHG